MRRSSKALPAAACAAVLAAAPAGALPRYDAEVSRLLVAVQRGNVDLIREELLRQAKRMDIGSMRVLLAREMPLFRKQVSEALTENSDVVEDYRRAITNMSPGDASDIDKLVAEVRRRHDLRPGPPLERAALPARTVKAARIHAEAGAGADAESAARGAPPPGDTAAEARLRFGIVGEFLRRRKWDVDFYLGAFADVAARYRKLGYSRAYRLRAPYASFGRSAYVLSPKPGLRPRLVYCEFDGRDLYLDTRAQWAASTSTADDKTPRTHALTCPDCRWPPPGVEAMRSLLATVPYIAREIVVGCAPLFAAAWEKNLLGIYENDYWRLAYYKNAAGVVALVSARRTDFGEILAASLTPMVRRGANAVYFAASAASLDPVVGETHLVAPTGLVSYDGTTRLSFENVLARRGKPVLFSGLPSPLLATREWLQAAKGRGVVAYGDETSRLVEEAGRWTRVDGGAVDLGIGVFLGGISGLHPEEDRDAATADSADQTAKLEYRDAVLSALKDAARDKNP